MGRRPPIADPALGTRTPAPRKRTGAETPAGRPGPTERSDPASGASAEPDGRPRREPDPRTHDGPPGDGRGRDADRPSELPARAWRDIATRVAAEVRADNVPLLAAGVAFFGLVSLFPALVALVSLYGLVADPADVARQLEGLTRAMPPQAAELVVEQARTLAAASNPKLGIGVAVGLLTSLWSASTGMRWLLSALSLAYDEREGRRFVRLRLTALGFTAGAATAFAATIGLITGSGALARRAGLGSGATTAVDVLRWPVLGALVLTGLAVLYRYGPDRSPARWRWVTWGSTLATGLTLVASVGFALYTSFTDGLDVYGSFGGIVVLMLWLLTTAFAVLLGAEVNAEMEHQTARDSTTGPPAPLGRRGAIVADEVAGAGR